MKYTAAEIAAHLQGEVAGDPALLLTGFARADLARPGDLTFAENEKYFTRAIESAASAVLVGSGFNSAAKTLIRVADPRVAFARVLPLFFPERAFAPGVHPTALIAASAQIDPSAHVGPYVVIGERVVVGPRCVLEGGDYIGDDCSLGEGCHLFPQVTLYPRSQLGARVRLHGGVVVGSDGFGYVFDAGRHLKVAQIGNVIIHDDVEIGANSTVDRGALGPTIIGRGTKIDNLVQVAHNVVIGEHCILVSQVGISGSTTLGNYVTLAGQVGLVGHLKIGDRVTVGGKSGVMHNIPAGESWFGYPAQPDRQAKRMIVARDRVPELIRRMADLERELAALKRAIGERAGDVPTDSSTLASAGDAVDLTPSEPPRA